MAQVNVMVLEVRGCWWPQQPVRWRILVSVRWRGDEWKCFTSHCRWGLFASVSDLPEWILRSGLRNNNGKFDQKALTGFNFFYEIRSM